MWALLHRGFCIEVCAAFMSCVHTNKKRKAFEMYTVYHPGYVFQKYQSVFKLLVVKKCFFI